MTSSSTKWEARPREHCIIHVNGEATSTQSGRGMPTCCPAQPTLAATCPPCSGPSGYAGCHRPHPRDRSHSKLLHFQPRRSCKIYPLEQRERERERARVIYSQQRCLAHSGDRSGLGGPLRVVSSPAAEAPSLPPRQLICQTTGLVASGAHPIAGTGTARLQPGFREDDPKTDDHLF